MNPQTLANQRRSHFFILALIIALAAILRLFSLSALGYWTDEFCTLSCSHGWGLQFDMVPMAGIVPARPAMTRLAAAQPITQIIPAMVRDEAHPPLYFLLLRLWEDALGDGEFAVRSLNIIFSLIAIVLLFLVAAPSVGATTALWACLLMALAEPQIQFSQEARNYMPVVAFSLLATWCIQQLKRRPVFSYSLVLSLATLAMMLTHYFAAGIAVGLAIYCAFLIGGRARWLALCGLISAGFLFSVLWGPGFFAQSPNFRGNYAWISDARPGHFSRLLTNLSRLPWRLVAELPANRFLQIGAEVFGAMFFMWLPVAYIRRPELRLWIIWLVGSIGIIVTVDAFRSTAQLALLRYSLFATPALYVLFAAAISRGRWRRILPAAAIVLAIFSLPAAYVPAWKIDFRTPVQIISHRLDPKDALIIIGPDSVNNGVMFAAFKHYLPTMPATTAVFLSPPDHAALANISACPHVWIIWTWPRKLGDLPDFQTNEEQEIPYFADIVLGKFTSPASQK